jgi:hypothetical protein
LREAGRWNFGGAKMDSSSSELSLADMILIPVLFSCNNRCDKYQKRVSTGSTKDENGSLGFKKNDQQFCCAPSGDPKAPMAQK